MKIFDFQNYIAEQQLNSKYNAIPISIDQFKKRLDEISNWQEQKKQTVIMPDMDCFDTLHTIKPHVYLTGRGNKYVIDLYQGESGKVQEELISYNIESLNEKEIISSIDKLFETGLNAYTLSFFLESCIQNEIFNSDNIRSKYDIFLKTKNTEDFFNIVGPLHIFIGDKIFSLYIENKAMFLSSGYDEHPSTITVSQFQSILDQAWVEVERDLKDEIREYLPTLPPDPMEKWKGEHE